MRETRPSGSEGGEPGDRHSPTPIGMRSRTRENAGLELTAKARVLANAATTRCRCIPRAVRNGVFEPQAQAFALMTSNLQTPAPSATGQTRPHFRPRDV
jgi:hypothetical protein